jgi:hypothetical protein
VTEREDSAQLLAAFDFDGALALVVRPLANGGGRIVSGYPRALAAKQAGLDEVTCWAAR